MKKSRWFYERPYTAHNEAIPEKEGMHYVIGVLKGLNYWRKYEMSLWKAWGVALIALLPILLLGYIEESTRSITGIVTVGVTITVIYLYLFCFTVLWFNAVLSTIDRLEGWLFATEKRKNIFIVLFLIGMIASITTFPSEILAGIKHIWSIPMYRYGFYVIFGFSGFNFILSFLLALLEWRRGKNK
jgi:hypothetical protein